MEFVQDSFTDTNGTTVASHTGEVGATWATHPSFGQLGQIASNRVRPSVTSGAACYYASGIPRSAEYDVSADVVFLASNNLNSSQELYGRFSTTVNDHYDAIINANVTTLMLRKVIGGSGTVLGTTSQTFSANTTYRLKLSLRDNLKALHLDGVERLTSSDNALAAANRAGFLVVNFSSVGDTIGPQLDNFSAVDARTLFRLNL